MTSAQIRQSFLDFFAKQGHTIVPSASLLPDSPGLLFTNAGMNQFVPIFLGDRAPDVSKWAGVKPGKDTRAADTQKCIRAGGKHNDLEDVGFDTYHHTMFEMLGNWSFGDYFKQESLTWGWELLTSHPSKGGWGIPPKRLFATVFCPYMGQPNWEQRWAKELDYFLEQAKQGLSLPVSDTGSVFERSDFEAAQTWALLFKKADLDPTLHIVPGNKKDNFWMMGDTGPCGPCSEIHFNLLPSDDEAEGRKLVNSSSPRCIEIWNHVFIQFNANADGTFSPLAAKHVDTGMGFERVAGIYATTNGFKDFSKDPSNYAADVFAPLFKKVTELSGKTYTATVPTKREGLSEQENTDIAFRVLADHARTISCAIADGILPGNEGRNYVIRRILRRGILYGKKLGLSTGFFEQLVAPVVESLGPVFPELKQQQSIIQRVIRSEEESFGRTLDRGLALFQDYLRSRANALHIRGQAPQANLTGYAFGKHNIDLNSPVVSGSLAFELYDTYGFPLDMTQLLATERGLTVDTTEFERLMEEQRERGKASTKKVVVVAATEGDATDLKPTKFLGYTATHAHGQLADVITADQDTFLVFDQTPFYAEMGGQTGDTGSALVDGQLVHIVDCVKDKSGRHLHKVAAGSPTLTVGAKAELSVDVVRRRAINRHHSSAHLIHWALRKVLGTHVRQAGTSKTADRMRFDFSHFEAVTHAQLQEIEQLVNEKVIDNAKVETYETEFDKKPEGTLAFFGDKYGKIVRVVDIGGYSRELCGGTHVATTGEIGLIKLVAEMAIAAGTRRIEAVAGAPAYGLVTEHETALKTVGAKLNAGAQDVVQKLDSLLAHQKELERKLKVFEQKAAAGLAEELAAKATARDGLKFVSTVVSASDNEALRSLGSQVLAKLGEGVVVLGAAFGEKPALVVFCSPAAIKAGHQAGKIVGELAGKLGGKGGGKPDFAMGGGKDASQLAAILAAR